MSDDGKIEFRDLLFLMISYPLTAIGDLKLCSRHVKGYPCLVASALWISNSTNFDTDDGRMSKKELEKQHHADVDAQ